MSEKRNRMDPDTRKQQIIEAGLFVARRDGIDKLTMSDVAVVAKCSKASVNHYFKIILDLRTAIVAEALEREEYDILAPYILSNHPSIQNLTREQRQGVLDSIQAKLGL